MAQSTTTQKTHELIVPEGRVGKFQLHYEHTHTEEDFSRVNYYTPASDRETMRVTFSFKGNDFNVPSWQVSKISPFTSDKTKNMLKEAGYKHYVGTHIRVNKKEFFAVVPITEKEYIAIHSWFDSIKLKKEEHKIAPVKPVTEVYAKEIQKAKESGELVVIYRGTKDGSSKHSDTDLVTKYIDGDGKITTKVEPMH